MQDIEKRPGEEKWESREGGCWLIDDFGKCRSVGWKGKEGARDKGKVTSILLLPLLSSFSSLPKLFPGLAEKKINGADMTFSIPISPLTFYPAQADRRERGREGEGQSWDDISGFVFLISRKPGPSRERSTEKCKMFLSLLEKWNMELWM